MRVQPRTELMVNAVDVDLLDEAVGVVERVEIDVGHVARAC